MAGPSSLSFNKEESSLAWINDTGTGKLNSDAFKKLHIDKDSWQGNQKKELTLSIMECVGFFKEWNISSPDHLLVPFIKKYLDKIDSFEEGVLMENKIAQSANINAAINENNKSLERNLKYNDQILNSLKVSSLESKVDGISLKSEGVHLPMRDIPILTFERINELLEVIDKQEDEINELLATNVMK